MTTPQAPEPSQPEQLEPRDYRLTRADLVAYAEASGDPNPIHQDEEVARAVGLPGVIAHGMLTLALAARYVDEWLGEPGHVVELGAKFTRPVVVPAGEQGAVVTISGVADTKDGRRVVALTVTCDGQKVLGNPRAVLDR